MPATPASSDMTLYDRLRVGVTAMRVRAHMQWEGLNSRGPTRLTDIPPSVDVITREWLEAVLCSGTPGSRVEHFDLGALNIGTTSRRPIHVAYNEAGRRAKLPEFVFGKATPQFVTRLLCGLSGAIASEVNFYNKVRPLLQIETLHCHFAAFHPGSFRSILLFDDLAKMRNARFLDPHHHFTRSQAESMIDAMAGLHGRFWDSPELDRFTWMKDALAYQHHIDHCISFKEVALAGIRRAAPLLASGVRERLDELWPALLRSCELRVQGPQTLLHADIHPGNWYLIGESQMGLTDWQCTVKGQWAADVAYCLSSCLRTEDRRAWEKDLLALYLQKLQVPSGSTAPTFEQAWLAYRQQTLHGLFNWLFVAGATAKQPEMQPEDFGRINLERMSTALSDLGTLDSLNT